MAEMVNITIDGKSIQAEKGKNLMQVSRKTASLYHHSVTTNTSNRHSAPAGCAPAK